MKKDIHYYLIKKSSYKLIVIIYAHFKKYSFRKRGMGSVINTFWASLDPLAIIILLVIILDTYEFKKI